MFVDGGESIDLNSGKIIRSGGRTHPVYIFLTAENQYICEVRYGGKSANALQRGFWTHTERAEEFFDSLTDGWIDYSHNKMLVRLFSLALNSTSNAHELSCRILQDGIDSLKKM